MVFFAHIITWINILTNALGEFLLFWFALLPGWLSNTIMSAIMAVLVLLNYKYTSNQRALGRVRDNIKADMLALKLFKDSILVTLQSEGRLFKGALLVLLHSLRPILVMIIPISFLVAQLGLWYQARPLLPTEETVVTMKLNDKIESSLFNIGIEATDAVEVMAGPVRILSQHQICWKIKACESGYHRIFFKVGQERIEKQLSIGDGFMRLSAERPGWHWADILLNPLEKPLARDSIVQSISINYPDRLSRTSGTDWWLIYFLVSTFVFALLFKPFLKVRI
ncbi:MAG: hypothetical protein ACYS9Y_09110 [Planctomycetota bacterium]|jgi:uncharacterized membrane protein (DUF106 family)